MTAQDVKNIFGLDGDEIVVNGAVITVADFLNVAGFNNAPDNPSKQDLHDTDDGKKGYAGIIEQGVYN